MIGKVALDHPVLKQLPITGNEDVVNYAVRIVGGDCKWAIELGGEYLPQHPHIYVECTRTGEFFETKYQVVLKGIYGASRTIYSPKIEDRAKYFPKRFPNPNKQPGQLKNLPE
ncbi:MAG TPA: hypothetical protein DIU00_16415 [Phycisphaerales bacterium]|nr:hypothetical protein [Phycisphaerales bacterium]